MDALSLNTIILGILSQNDLASPPPIFTTNLQIEAHRHYQNEALIELPVIATVCKE